jgi:hypothetical protein
MGLALSTQPLLGIPFSVVAIAYGLTYKDNRKLSFVRLINFIAGMAGVVLSILTIRNMSSLSIDYIFVF